MAHVAITLSAFGLSVLAVAAPVRAAENAASGHYLFAWSGDADEQDSDFLAVVDTNPASKSYGQVVATTPIGVKAVMPHHVEYETPPGTILFANGWKASHSFVLDIAEPRKPRVTVDFKRAGNYSYPHSFARLPNGNVVATFQSIGDKYAPPGGLVEMDDKGQVVRANPSTTPDIPNEINWPYSLAVVPAINRIVTTSTDMGLGTDWKSPETSHVQFWSIDELKPVASVALPDPTKERYNIYPAEPRLLNDGSIYVATFSCGLFKIDGAETEKPTAKQVFTFPSGKGEEGMCSVPVVVGKYWVQTANAINGLVVLDTSDPDKPVEVSRLSLPHGYHMPHWISVDRETNRIAVTGMYDSWLAMVKLDEATGQLSMDTAFGDGGGVQFDRPSWPHGKSGKAIVHGVVFSR